MNLKFLLRNWSSVSAAAAVLLGSSGRASANVPQATVEGPKLGEGDVYEPLILKPHGTKTMSEERFAGHRSHSSHSSHRSHASHSSHYSGAGYRAPANPSRAYSPPAPPAPAVPNPTVPPRPSLSPTGNLIRVELENGTIIYGNVIVRAAAGITVTASDGTTYKFTRKQLSARTISDLVLPPEQSQLPSAATTTDIVGANQSKEAMARQIAELEAENAALRQQVPTATPVTAEINRSSSAPVTYRVEGLPKNSPFLNIREGPGSDYPILVSLPRLARGITFGTGRVRNGGTIWQEITTGGYTGWANAQYLVAETPSP